MAARFNRRDTKTRRDHKVGNLRALRASAVSCPAPCSRGSAHTPNAKVSDGSQPPMMFDLSLSETAGSRSLDRLVRLLSVLDSALLGESEAE